MKTLTDITVEQGPGSVCTINSATVIHESHGVAIVEVDCDTKHPTVAACSGRKLCIGSEGGPSEAAWPRLTLHGAGDVMLIAEGDRYTLYVAVLLIPLTTAPCRRWDFQNE